MKRFILFAGDRYYPRGGWNDFIKSFDSIEECLEKSEVVSYNEKGYDWAHLLDIEKQEIVWEHDPIDTFTMKKIVFFKN